MKTTRHCIWWWLAVWFLAVLPSAQAFYDPGAQRWINRDPIGEEDGANLFKFPANDPVGHTDHLGLKCYAVVVSGHGSSCLKPTFQSLRDGPTKGGPYMFVGCGANTYNQSACDLGFGVPGFPINDWKDEPPYPKEYNDGKRNPNFPEHMPGWPEIADDDYVDSELMSEATDAAIQAMKTTLCKNPKCKAVRIKVRCQPLSETEKAQGLRLNKNCGKVIKLECDKPRGV